MSSKLIAISGILSSGFIVLYAQNVGISATGTAPNPDAGLDVDFSDKGLLIPRVALSNLTTYNPPITSGGNVASLMVYNTNNTLGQGYYYWNGNRWVKLLTSGSPADAWLTNGNSNTNPTSHFLGTTDNVGLSLRTNSNEVMRLTPNARVGIGTAFPYFKVDVYDTLDWGGIQVMGAKNSQIVIHAPNNYMPQFTYLQNNQTRFTLNVAPSGDYWAIGRFDNTGNYIESNLFVNRNTGYIGINRAYPTAVLHVYKDVPNLVLIERPSANNAHIQYTNTNGTLYAGLSPFADWAIGPNINLASNSYFTVKYTNGYVGIGTNAPAVNTHIHSTGNSILRISSAIANSYKGIQVGSTNGWFFGESNGGDFIINRDIPLGMGIVNIFRIYSSTNSLMSHFFSRNSGISGNGSNNDGPTNVIIEAGSAPGRYYDWPNGWMGGLSTFDICGASTFMNGYFTRSDAEFKKDIQSIKLDTNFISKFMKLNPVTYRFNPESIKSNKWDYDRLHYGFIANEVEKLFPDLVVNAGIENAKKGLEYDAFIPMLIKMVQEQYKEIQKLKKEIEKMKN